MHSQRPPSDLPFEYKKGEEKRGKGEGRGGEHCRGKGREGKEGRREGRERGRKEGFIRSGGYW